MASLKDIESRQKLLLQLFDQLQKEEDMTRYLQIVQQMEGVGRELEALALDFEKEMSKGTRRASGFVEVVLLPEQRKKVLEQTGISMNTVLIADPGGEINMGMPGARPAEIEAEALRQAWKVKGERQARAEAKVQLEKDLEELSAVSEVMAEQVQRMREDPKVKAILDWTPDKK
jgi:hypothetical protein